MLDFVTEEREEMIVGPRLLCPVMSACSQSDRAGLAGDCLTRETGWPQTEPSHFTPPVRGRGANLAEMVQCSAGGERDNVNPSLSKSHSNETETRGDLLSFTSVVRRGEGIQIKSCSRNWWLLPVRLS